VNEQQVEEKIHKIKSYRKEFGGKKQRNILFEYILSLHTTEIPINSTILSKCHF
jgi:hypothetical protein